MKYRKKKNEKKETTNNTFINSYKTIIRLLNSTTSKIHIVNAVNVNAIIIIHSNATGRPLNPTKGIPDSEPVA